MYKVVILLLFIISVMFDSLWPCGMQHVRLPYPSPSARAFSNSCPLSQWIHPTISSSVVPFSWLQSFPTSGSFSMSQLFASGGQSIGPSASASVLPVNMHDFIHLCARACVYIYIYMKNDYLICKIISMSRLDTTSLPSYSYTFVDFCFGQRE